MNTIISTDEIKERIEAIKLLSQIPASQRANFAREEAKIVKNNTAVVNGRNGGQYTYQYTTYGKMMDVISPIISKWGLGIDTIFEGISPSNPHIYEVKMTMYDALSSYKTVNERITIASMYACGRIDDNTDTKGYGSVQSYVRKYCLSSFFPMGSEADVDEISPTDKNPGAIDHRETTNPENNLSRGAAMFIAFTKGMSKEEKGKFAPVVSDVCSNPINWRQTMTEEEAQEVIDRVVKEQGPEPKPETEETNVSEVKKGTLVDEGKDTSEVAVVKNVKTSETSESEKKQQKSEGAKKLIHWMKQERRMTMTEMNEVKDFIDTIAPVNSQSWKTKLSLSEADEIIAEYERMKDVTYDDGIDDLPDGLENMVIDLGPDHTL